MDEKALRRRFTEIFDEHDIETDSELSRRLIAKLAKTAVEAMKAEESKPKPTVVSRFTKSTPVPKTSKTAPKQKEMPDELVHALECDDEHEFVQDCLRQWEEKQWLSERQLEALGGWKPKGEYDD
jgi:hypothetical protein